MGGRAALVVVIGFSIILGLIIRNMSMVSVRAQGNMGTYATSAESHHLAITGANVGLARLYQDTLWRGSETQNLSNAFNGSFTYTISDGVLGLPVLRSVSTVRGPNEVFHDTVVVVFGPRGSQSFSLFGWITEEENGIYWISGDTIWGRAHSNDILWLSGSPTFMEKVTTVRGFSEPWGTGNNNAVFKRGYETGIGPIRFPSTLSGLTTAAASGGRSYAGDVTVTMGSVSGADNDGFALVYSGGSLIDSVDLQDPTFNGVMGASGRVSISGQLDGRLSVVSSSSIYITDNILYENRDSVSNDVLGLISEHDIIIADNGPNATDVWIDGSLFSRSGSFAAENHSTGSPRGRIFLNGSIAQHRRGVIGSFDAGGIIQSGYLKRYFYDVRLANPGFHPPFYPGFAPLSYPIASWWENVRIPRFD